MKRSIISRAILVVLSMMLLMSSSSIASAANVCEYMGGTEETVSFKLTTGNKFLLSNSITFKQTKGRIKYTKFMSLFFPTKTVTYRSAYTITAVAQNGKTTTVDWSSAKYTLKLDPNTKYTITVRYAGPEDLLSYAWYMAQQDAVIESKPSWRVSSTYRIARC